MELEIPFSVIFTSFFFFLFLLWKIVKAPSSKNLPPGPWKLPLVSNLLQFVGSLPHHSLRNLANKYGPIIHLQLGEVPHIIVSSSEIAKEILKTHDATLANRPYFVAAKIFTYDFTDIAFSPYGKCWSQLRNICSLELLSPKRVESFRFTREEEVSAFIKEISEKEGSLINLSKGILSSTNGITARSAFGAKCKDKEAFISTMHQVVKLAGFSIADLYPSIEVFQVITRLRAKCEKLFKENDGIIENILRDHKEKQKNNYGEAEEDLVDVLLKIQQQNNSEFHLTDDNIKGVILVIMLLIFDYMVTFFAKSININAKHISND